MFEKILVIVFTIVGSLILILLTGFILTDLIECIRKKRKIQIIEHVIYLSVTVYFWILLFVGLISYFF